jgi:thermostable 8-oxoguanine DNA glycosylase
MHANWTITKKSLDRWNDFVKSLQTHPLVVERRNKNVDRVGIELSKNAIWKIVVGCQVTTQQQSGVNTNVGQFFASNSRLLNYTEFSNQDSISALATQELNFYRLRRFNIIAENLESIFVYLKNGGWTVLKAQLASIKEVTSIEKERKVIEYLQGGSFPGLGPKQARNFIQWLGLSKYEIPIDSRVLKRLKEFGSDFVPAGSSLSDPVVYLFVQHLLQVIASSQKIFPCELDACIFSSFEPPVAPEHSSSNDERKTQ